MAWEENSCICLNMQLIAILSRIGVYTLKKAIIITYEDEGEIERNGLRIEIIPSWKWVLNEGHSDTNRQYIYY